LNQTKNNLNESKELTPDDVEASSPSLKGGDNIHDLTGKNNKSRNSNIKMAKTGSQSFRHSENAPFGFGKQDASDVGSIYGS
jgi:hypothetical protein